MGLLLIGSRMRGNLPSRRETFFGSGMVLDDKQGYFLFESQWDVEAVCTE